MHITRTLSRRLILWSGIALLIWPSYELYVRVDAMAGPLKMFFNMATGEGIPLMRALRYVDWQVFATPFYLLLCLIAGIIAICKHRKRTGYLFLIPYAIALAAWGWLRTPLFRNSVFRMLEMLPFAALLLGSILRIAANIASARAKKRASRKTKRAKAPNRKAA